MKVLGMEIVEGPLEAGQMLVHSGDYIFAWDFAKDGGDCCVTARRLPDGRVEIVEIRRGERNG